MLKNTASIPLSSKREVWLRDVGSLAVGRCALGCGREISVPEAVRRSLRWEVAGPLGAPVAHFGHVRARSRGGGNGPENLRAICPKCNLDMGVMDMREYARSGAWRRPGADTPDLMEIDQVGRPRGCLGITARGDLCRNLALRRDLYCAVHRGSRTR